MSFSALDVEDGGDTVVDGEEKVRRMPAEVSWEMLEKLWFFLLDVVLFSGGSAALYPTVVLKTYLQVAPLPLAMVSAVAVSILRRDGPQWFYRSFGASLAGTLYMATLEATRSVLDK